MQAPQKQHCETHLVRHADILHELRVPHALSEVHVHHGELVLLLAVLVSHAALATTVGQFAIHRLDAAAEATVAVLPVRVAAVSREENLGRVAMAAARVAVSVTAAAAALQRSSGVAVAARQLPHYKSQTGRCNPMSRGHAPGRVQHLQVV